MTPQCQTGINAIPQPPTLRDKLRRMRWKFFFWFQLNIWARWFYRPTMRLLHRFNLHYAPPTMMSPEYGKRDHYCQWCGLYGHTWKVDPSKGLEQFEPTADRPTTGASDFVRWLTGECIKPSESTREAAYGQGKAALSQAYSRDQNPYEKGTDLHAWWDSGYCDEADELSPR